MAPFSNLKVLDLSADFAGSYCSKLLSDFGASVKKIIYEGREDRSASYGPVSYTHLTLPPIYSV